MSRSSLLILSGAYIDQELAAEFGPLPPSFLPVGMRRLFEMQLELFSKRDGEVDVFLTLPADFEPDSYDTSLLAAAGATLIPSPRGIGLGRALLHALSAIGFEERPIRILHGDTLIQGLDLDLLDVVSAGPVADGYYWAAVREEGGRIASVLPPHDPAVRNARSHLSGYFSFSSLRLLAQALARAENDFIAALNLYASERPLTALKQGDWFDFGHVQTFFRSRRVVSTARAFNRLEITSSTVSKRSDRSEKLRAEAQWLAKVPPDLQIYCARLIDEKEDEDGYSYATEYEYTPTLAELYAFGRLNRATWRQIIASCAEFMDAAAKHRPHLAAGLERPAIEKLTLEKTRHRVQQFAEQSGIDLERPLKVNGKARPSIRASLKVLGDVIASVTPRPAIMHGDFCFSNILYCFRSRRIRLIDPRGSYTEGAPSIFGDSLYDAAKFMHSLTGGYDLIIANRFTGSEAPDYDLEFALISDPERDWLAEDCNQKTLGGVALDGTDVQAVMASLFLSMLPLHADQPRRQAAFLATAVNLVAKLDGGGAP